MITIVSALTIANTFFIFRETGQEVEIVLTENSFKTNHKLTEKEADYIREKIL